MKPTFCIDARNDGTQKTSKWVKLFSEPAQNGSFVHCTSLWKKTLGNIKVVATGDRGGKIASYKKLQHKIATNDPEWVRSIRNLQAFEELGTTVCPYNYLFQIKKHKRKR